MAKIHPNSGQQNKINMINVAHLNHEYTIVNLKKAGGYKGKPRGRGWDQAEGVMVVGGVPLTTVYGLGLKACEFTFSQKKRKK